MKILLDLINIDKKKSLIDIKSKIEFLKRELDINIKERNQKDNKLINFLELLIQFPNAINWILNQEEINFQSLERFIIDSDKNEHLTLKIIDLKKIKKYFEELQRYIPKSRKLLDYKVNQSFG